MSKVDTSLELRVELVIDAPGQLNLPQAIGRLDVLLDGGGDIGVNDLFCFLGNYQGYQGGCEVL